MRNVTLIASAVAASPILSAAAQQLSESAALSPDESAALHTALNRCWAPPPGVASYDFVVVRIRLNHDGSMSERPVLVQATASPAGSALIESVKRALTNCQPFRMLRPEHYESWKELEIKFDPHDSAHPANNPYEIRFSEKVEADNGAVYAVDLKSARQFGSNVLANVYDEGQGGMVGMLFDCAGHMGPMDGPMTYVPPRSVGARLAAIACAEANRHPER
jgi:hypothetical protein